MTGGRAAALDPPAGRARGRKRVATFGKDEFNTVDQQRWKFPVDFFPVGVFRSQLAPGPGATLWFVNQTIVFTLATLCGFARS